MILRRYLYREVLQSFVAVMVVLLLIYVSNRFVRYLAQAASGYIGSDAVVELLLLKLGENLALLLPLALFLAVLLALGRLYRDSEVIAMAASGIGVRHLALLLSGLAMVFAIIAGALSLYFSPSAAALQQELFEQAKGEAQIAGVQPGRFREFGEGQRVGYVESISEDGREMRNVFLQIQRGDRQDLIVARRASPALEGVERTRYMVLEDGYRYTGAPGDLDFVVTRFERHAVRLEQDDGSGYRKRETFDSLRLLREGGPENLAELQWRLSIPVSVLLLTLLAIVMARTTPRQGRYARLVLAFIVYFLYNNAVGIAQKLVERGDLSAVVGVWPVHLIFAAAVLAVLYRQSAGRWPTLPRWRRRRGAAA